MHLNVTLNPVLPKEIAFCYLQNTGTHCNLHSKYALSCQKSDRRILLRKTNIALWDAEVKLAFKMIEIVL